MRDDRDAPRLTTLARQYLWVLLLVPLAIVYAIAGLLLWPWTKPPRGS